MNYLDDDSENDSDYVPEEDVVEESSNHKRRKGESGEIVGINSRRLRQATSLWEEIQNEDKEYVKDVMLKAVNNSLTYLERPSKKTQRRARNFMNRNFRAIRPKRSIDNSISLNNNDGTNSNSDLRAKVMQAVSGLTRKTTVTEKRKFAGQEITVQSTVTKKAKDEETSKPASALDQALNLIKGPKAINTVSKSSMDWENYKEKEGLQDDLAHSKENFLDRKEFLDRCDYRSFEQERDERLAKQALRGTG